MKTLTNPEGKPFKKETVTVTIALHWIQARIIKGIQQKEINLNTHSLREIGEKIGSTSPQQIKHHVEQLVKYGCINIVNGQYTENNLKQ